MSNKTLLSLRQRAITLYKEGHKPQEIAKMLSLHQDTVYAWIRIYKEKGEEELLNIKTPGPSSKLTIDNREELNNILDKSPREYKYIQDIWSLRIIKDIIYKKFNVILEKSQIANILHQIGQSFKNVIEKPIEQDENKVKEFEEKWESTKKKLYKRIHRRIDDVFTLYFIKIMV